MVNKQDEFLLLNPIFLNFTHPEFSIKSEISQRNEVILVNLQFSPLK
jgi:hypothetical protein